MIYSVEKISVIWDEILPNLYQYYKTSLYKQGKFKPDFNKFKYFEDNGFFILFTARQEGSLVGHCGMYLTQSMYTDALVATEDGWYMQKAYREINNPLKAYIYVEKELYKRNVKQLTMTTELKIDGIMKKLGYNQIANQYSKYLDGGADSTIEDKL